MIEINEAYIEKRNEFLIKYGDEACDWGQAILEEIEKTILLKKLPEIYVPIAKHATKDCCPKCIRLLAKAAEKARNVTIH